MDSTVVLKGGVATLITLHFGQSDLAAITAELQKKKSEAATLFRNLPCALDLQGFDPQQLDLSELLNICRHAGLLPIAVRNAGSAWAAILTALQLADLGRTQPSKNANLTEQSPPPSRIYQGNVRSGQQLYHDGDLVIFGTISAGAEVLASGSLHIYGSLRGRALAGVKGNEQAIICAQHFDPELVAIAGQYKLLEERQSKPEAAACVSLTDGRLNIAAL